jgi:Integrase core domain
MNTELTREARDELVGAVRSRYRAATCKEERKRMLTEFIAVTGYHPKSALRVLHQEASDRGPLTRRRPRLYDEAARQALIVLWEASDRVCGKRLKPLLRTLLPAMERHGHLRLDPTIREKLLGMSAATMDRLLRAARAPTKRQRSRRVVSEVRQRIPVRTFGDWHHPDPGAMEMDLVAHCGAVAKGSFIHSLVLTDIATGWTECAPLVVREGTLVVETLERVRRALPFPLRALDTDNGSEFVNESLVQYCAGHGIELTRSRPWLKNDQAWIEQKNGAIVRKMLGDLRYAGIAATQCLGRLYTALRFFVNFFQTSFKLAEKTREGAAVNRRYLAPATPCERLLAHPAIAEPTKVRLTEVAEMLDPIRLLEEVRAAQRQLAVLASGGSLEPLPQGEPDLVRFLANLSTAWRDGEVRPTHALRDPVTVPPTPRIALPSVTPQVAIRPAPPAPMPPPPVVHVPAVARAKTDADNATGPSALRPPRAFVRRRMRKHAYVTVWPQVTRWLEACPNMSAAMIFDQLRALYPGRYESGQIAALERRVRAWRQVAVARGVVIGRRMYRQSPTRVRWRTRPDPFATDWPEICQLLEADPDQSGKELFVQLGAKYPGRHQDGQLRTLQRRLKGWRAEAVRKLVFDLQTQPLAAEAEAGPPSSGCPTAPVSHPNPERGAAPPCTPCP